MRFTPQLTPSRTGDLCVLLLNNAKALNALSLEMMYTTQDILHDWLQSEDGPTGILIKSTTEGSKVPSFCAGGDVKKVCQAGLTESGAGQGKPGLESAEFFRQEYIVNHILATLSTSSVASYHGPDTPKYKRNPVVMSFWDGLTMGGGVGISIYGRYRIATERTLWAMPETGIGLFPDVGSFFWMPRLLSPPMALYLALSGRRLKAPDLLYSGIATHYIPSSKLGKLEEELSQASTVKSDCNTDDPFGAILDSFHECTDPPPDESELRKDAADIERYFSQPESLESLMANLATSETDTFGARTHSTLVGMSPTSLKVTKLGLERGAKMKSITEDLKMEFRLSQGFLRPRDSSKPDFYEGIRAALIDKDREPVWNPATLEEVSEKYVESFFEPVEFEFEHWIPSEQSSRL